MLNFELSPYLIIPSLLLAAGGAWFLYHKNKLEFEGKYGDWIDKGLIAFRFVSLFVLALLILGPLVKWISRKTEKPFIILAIDNSQSIIAGKDSATIRKQIPEFVSHVKSELGDEYDVRPLFFGKDISEKTQPDFSDKQTNIANVFSNLAQTYDWQQTGAIVLATDGIYNEGVNPLYAATETHAPVYALALGDTVQQKDLLIQQVRHNQLVYSGNSFPLSIDVKSFGYAATSTNLSVSHNGSVIQTKNIAINSSAFFSTINIEIEAKEEGMQHYFLNLSSLKDEASLVNNRFDVFVQVINGKQKVKIIALAPHPDLSALKQAIGNNENYEASIGYANETSINQISKEISLVVLHQLPGIRGEGANLIKQLNEKRIPILYVLGAGTNVPLWNSVEPALQIMSNRGNMNEALPNVQESFASFTLSNDEAAQIKKFPPLIVPYGNYTIRAEADVLMKQQIGYVKTEYPLWFFTRAEGVRKGFICGEGIWKWRLHDFAQNEQQQTVNTLISKTVQYLAAKEDKGRFRVNHPKRFNENEPIVFDAEVYNESYELVNTSDVQITITDNRQKQFEYTFSKSGKGYHLDAGMLPVGTYTYVAKTVAGNKPETLKGRFIVAPLQIEFLNTTADHQLLQEIAQQSGGKVFYPSETDKLINAIKENENIKPVIYKQEDIKSWINIKWIFFVLLGLLSVEWFVRKWAGSV